MVVAGAPPSEETAELARRAIERQVAEERLTPEDAEVVREALAL